jgi:GcrA cell cycle regulator
MSGSHWSEESITTLKSLWGTMPASWIAKRMGITKGMVIGKADRLNLRSVDRGRMQSMVMRNGKTDKVLTVPSPRKPKRTKPMQSAEIEMKLISIVELDETTCHWPVGDPQDWDNFRYCGLHKTMEAGPYCPHHYARSMKQFEAVFCDAA